MESVSSLRLKFFDLLFGNQEGWLCIALTHKDLPGSSFREEYYKWPNDAKKLENNLLDQANRYNIYFCSTLLKTARRIKINCMETDLVWADLDEINPSEIKDFPPGIILRTSADRWQAFWKMSTRIAPDQAEDYSRRIAYHLRADKSGWDLTQLFRVPFTTNYKYKAHPQVVIERALTATAPPSLFEGIKLPFNKVDMQGIDPMPQLASLPSTEAIWHKYQNNFMHNIQWVTLLTEEPGIDEDWSKLLWKFINVSYEADLDDDEIFAMALIAKCNKYARDGRPPEHLWHDIMRARDLQRKVRLDLGTGKLTMLKLVDEPDSETFIDQYKEWGEEATDAIPQYHELGAFVLLSSIIANSVRLHTAPATIVPNIWGLLLGDSTLARKTTSMRMVVDLLIAIDPEMIVATDGSAEGLLTGVSERPNKTSIFYRDEVSGFFDQMNRREYLSGMAETLTALYDVPPIYTRKLRKETIVLQSPSFIFFGGGIKDRVYQAISEEWIHSGFLPRFLVVIGESDVEKLRRTGPPNDAGIKKRAAILNHLSDIYEQYASDTAMKIGGQKVMMPPKIEAVPTQAAWNRYGDLEDEMVHYAYASPLSDLALPTFDRLSRSLLKLATLLAAERQSPNKENRIEVDVQDINNAAWYIQRWGQHSCDLITQSGVRASDRMIKKVRELIERNPGILRGEIMRRYNLNKKEADLVLDTLEEQGYVRKERSGNGFRYFPV